MRIIGTIIILGMIYFIFHTQVNSFFVTTFIEPVTPTEIKKVDCYHTPEYKDGTECRVQGQMSDWDFARNPEYWAGQLGIYKTEPKYACFLEGWHAEGVRRHWENKEPLNSSNNGKTKYEDRGKILDAPTQQPFVDTFDHRKIH